MGSLSVASPAFAVTLLSVAAVWLAVRKPALRKLLSISLLAALVLWAAGTKALALSERARVNADVELTDLDGKAVKLTDYVGKPLVVNLWASWCPPCRSEMPLLDRAQQANPDVTFVFVSLGDSVETVKKVLAEDGIVLDNVLLAPDWKLAKKMGARGTPTTFFFNASGKRVRVQSGPLSAATLAGSLKAVRALD